MADTERSKATLLGLLASNATGAITAQELRDLLVSVLGGYARIYVIDGATPQAVSATPTKIVCFAANGPSAGATPDHANDQITIGTTADYWVEFTASCSGDAQTYIARLRKNGSAEGTLAAEAKLDASGRATLHFAGPVTLAQNDILTVYVEAGGAANLTVKHGTLAVRRIG